jgi:hypothetical protein
MPKPSIATTAVLCLALAFTPEAAAQAVSDPVAHPAAQEAGAPGEVAASLMVEVATDEPQDLALRTRIFDEAGRVMAAMAVVQRARMDLPGIVITLRRALGDATVTGYSLAIRHNLLGETPVATIGGVCQRIAAEACVEKIVADLAVLLPRLHDYVRSSDPGTTAPPTAVPVLRPPDKATAAPPIPQPPRARKKLNRLGKAGIGVLSAGVAGLAVGIGLAVNPPRLNPDDSSWVITTQRPGYAFIGTGLSVMLAGTVMLIVGVRRSPRVLPVAHTFDGRSLGLGIVSRF